MLARNSAPSPVSRIHLQAIAAKQGSVSSETQHTTLHFGGIHALATTTMELSVCPRTQQQSTAFCLGRIHLLAAAAEGSVSTATQHIPSRSDSLTACSSEC